MPIYKVSENQILPLVRTTFQDQGIKERQNLQQMLKSKIEVISPDTLIVAEEFSDWEDSNRRIDLLGIDKNANLVVIELKRNENGDHMELQALRYAAMVSTMTFEKLTSVFQGYIDKNMLPLDAEEQLLEFLEVESVEEDQFGQEVNIVLASAEFSKELTTSVTWLINNYDLKIRCVRMQPYEHDGATFIDVQSIIPLPEVADYQVQISRKKQKERVSRTSERDLTKFDVTVCGDKFSAQNKRWAAFRVINGILSMNIDPEKVIKVCPSSNRNRLFRIFDGAKSAQQVREHLISEDKGGKVRKDKRFFTENDSEIFHHNEKTYVLSNQWGEPRFSDTIEALMSKFPEAEIHLEKHAD